MLPEPIDLPKTNAQKLSIHPPIRHAEPPIRLSKIQSKANPLCECATATHPHSGEPMDVLKRELQRKRQLLDADFGGRKLLRRAEIERREMERIREAERRLLLQKQLRSSSSHHRAASRSTTTPGAPDGDESSRAEHRGDGEEKEGAPLLPREEVIRRLRVLRQPATLFGEDDAARLRRLHAVLEDPAALADVEAAEIGEGQTNDFLREEGGDNAWKEQGRRGSRAAVPTRHAEGAVARPRGGMGRRRRRAVLRERMGRQRRERGRQRRRRHAHGIGADVRREETTR